MYRGRRPEAIDTRWAFLAYAALAGLTGLLLLSFGPAWFGTGPAGGQAALIRVFGSIVLAAGCCAAGFAAVDQPHARHRGLFWFAAGHTVIWLLVVVQAAAIRSQGIEQRIALLLWAVVFVLFYLWATSEGEYRRATLVSLFGSATPDSGERLRSQYEHQIREAARQEERNRLARDLHDSVKQQIFVIQTAAATAQARFDLDQAGAKAALEQVRGSAREAMTEMQAMLDQLRAVPLENAGLIEALKKQCEALGFRTGAQVEFRSGSLPPAHSVPPGAHEAILRAAQEALANIGRHARASNVLVSLTASSGHVEIRIRDDGAGFDPNQTRGGQGIANIHARAEEFGGTLELISRPGRGTSVTLSIPYTTAETAQEYRRKAMTSAVLLMISIAYLVWEKSPFMTAMSAFAAIGVVRYTLAYRRSQTRNKTAR